jgi:hypothetical protein
METEDMHTPLDLRTQALANAQAQGEDLRQRRQHQPPPALAHPRRNSEPNARNVADATRLRAHQVQQAIIPDANGPSQFARAGQNITAAVMLLRNLPEPTDPQQQEFHRDIQTFVERAAVQQEESSASRHRHAASYPVEGAGSQQPNSLIHQRQGLPP